jgi:hypothetical protein
MGGIGPISTRRNYWAVHKAEWIPYAIERSTSEVV